MKEIRVCNHCVMDTTDENIEFDAEGVCNRCREYEERILPIWNYGHGREDELASIIRDIKKSGEDKKYDCILGLSGGLDSSYLLHLAVKEWQLRPFVFHVDAGWNLPVAEENIKRLCSKLGVELHVNKMNWDEMRRMQIAFFKTGHAELDAPQDHAFIALVDYYSEQLGVKYILNGGNISTEVVADPASWAKGAGQTSDKCYIKDVLRRNGNVKVKDYTFTTGFKHKFYLPYIKGIKTVKLLNYVPYIKEDVLRFMNEEYGYISYGQKHFEDLLTKFLEGWWLPTRFGYDIRKAQLSSLVITGQMTRDEAQRILSEPPLTEDEAKSLFTQVANKLEISEDELLSYHNMEHKIVHYRSNEWLYSIGIWLYRVLGLDTRIRR